MKVDKYQTGGIIDPNNTASDTLVDNQMDTTTETDLINPSEDPLAKYQNKGLKSDTTISNDPLAKYQTKTPQTLNTIYSDDPNLPGIGPMPPAAKLIPTSQEKDIKALIDSGVIIPKGTDYNQIKFEDVKPVSPSMSYSYNPIAESDITTKLVKENASRLKRAILPDGTSYLFAPEGKTSPQDKLYDVGVRAAEAFSTGTVEALEVANNALRKVIGLDYWETLAGKKLDEERQNQGLFFTPLADKVRTAIQNNEVKVTPSAEDKINNQLLQDKIDNGEVDHLLTEPLYWKSLFNDKSFHDNLLQGAESMAEFMVPGVAVGEARLASRLIKLGQDVGTFSKLEKFKKGIDIVKGIGDLGAASFLSGSLEAHMEGENNGEEIAIKKYNSLMKSDKDYISSLDELRKAPESDAKTTAQQTYDKAYSDIFRANQLPLIVLNALPIAQLTGKAILPALDGAIGRFARANPWLTATIETGLESTSEGSQEVYQQGVQYYEEGKLLNNLTPLDNNIWEDIAGSFKSGYNTFNKDQGTTTAGLLGFLMGSIAAPGEIKQAYEQTVANNKARELLKGYSQSDFASIAGLFEKGKVNKNMLAQKVNAINSYVINENFKTASEKMNNPELMDYSYQQSIAGLVRDGLKSGIDITTIKDQISNLYDKYVKKGDKLLQDNDGSQIKYKDLLDKRLKLVDQISEAYAHSEVLQSKYKFDDVTKNGIFSSLVGQMYFETLSNKLSNKLGENNEKLKALKEQQAKVKAVQDELTSLNENVESEPINNEPVDRIKKDSASLVRKFNSARKVAAMYANVTRELITEKTLKRLAKQLKERKVETGVDDAITKEGSDAKVSDIKAKVTKAVKEENPKEDPKEIEKTVSKAVDERVVKAKEDNLKLEIPTLARNEGVNKEDLIDPPGKKIEPWERDIRSKIVENEIQTQAEEANREPQEDRYKGRPLLLAHEAEKALQGATNEQLDEINKKFIASKGMAPEALPNFANFLNSPLKDRLKDKDYANAIATTITVKPQEVEKVNPAELFKDQVEESKPEETSQTKPEVVEAKPEEIKDVVNPTQDVEIKRNKESVVVYHKNLKNTPSENEESVKTIYTVTAKQHSDGIAYLMIGKLSPGTIVHLEVESGLERNRNNPTWENLTIQAVIYDGDKRVVLGGLKRYSQYTATPNLSEVRQDIHKQWLANKGETIKSEWRTTVSEIYKGEVDKLKYADLTSMPATKDILEAGNLSIKDIEIGLVVGIPGVQQKHSTNSVKFDAIQDSNTKSTNRTGFSFLLLKSHKVEVGSKEQYYEPMRIFTRIVKDVPGYKDAIIKIIDSNELGDLSSLVSNRDIFLQKDKDGVVFATLNGDQIYGGENIYNALDIDTKPVQIDQGWLDDYENHHEIIHPVFNNIDVKRLIVDHLTTSNIDPKSINTYSYEGETKNSYFHSAKFAVNPWFQATEIKDVTPETNENVDIDLDLDFKISDEVFGKVPNEVYEDAAETKKWLGSRLEEIGYKVDDDVIDKLHNLLRLKDTSKLWGFSKQAAITLASKRPLGTTKHEAFHIVFNLFLTDKQREAAYREAWDLYKGDKEFGGFTKEHFIQELENLVVKEDEVTTGNDSKLREKYFGKSNTTSTTLILNKIANSNHPLATLAKTLLKYDPKISVKLVDKIINTDGSIINKANGAYVPNSNSIEINKNGIFKSVHGAEYAILHEVIHAITFNFIRNNSNLAIVKEFTDLFNNLKQDVLDGKVNIDAEQYALTNLDEFLAGVFTDARFITQLKEIPALKGKSYKNLFEEVFDNIRNFFKLSPQDKNLFTQAFSLGSQLIDIAYDSIEPKITGTEYYKGKGILTLLDEKMADAINEYKLKSAAPKWLVDKAPKLAKILDKLYNFLFKQLDILKSYINDDNRHIEDIYRQLENNSFGRNFFGQRRKSYKEIFNKNVQEQFDANRELANFRITSIPQLEIGQAISFINKDLINKVMSDFGEFKNEDKNQSLFNYVFSTNSETATKKLQSVYTKVKDLLENTYIPSALKSSDRATEQKQKDGYTEAARMYKTFFDLISLEYIEGKSDKLGNEAFDFTRRLLGDLEESQGLIIEGNTIVIDEERYANKEEDFSQYDEEEVTEEQQLISEDVPKDSYERWQIDSVTEKSFNKITPRFKKAMSSIAMLKDILNTKTGLTTQTIQKNRWGAIIYHDTKAIFDLLVEKLSSIESPEFMQAELDKIKNTDYRLKTIDALINADKSLAIDMWLGISNKYQIPWLMNKVEYSKLGTKINIFNSKQKNVVKSIAAAFRDKFNFLNWSSEGTKDFIGQDQIPFNEFKNLVNEVDPVKKRDNLPSVLSNLGFFISNKAASYLKGLTNYEINTIYEHVNFTVNLMSKNINPTDFAGGGAVTRIRDISRILRNADDNTDLKMFTNSKNKLVSGHIQIGYAVKLFDRIKRKIIDAKEGDELEAQKDRFAKENDFLFKRDSPLVQWVKDRKKIGATIALFDGRKRNSEEEGTEQSEMNPKLMHTNIFEFWLGGIMSALNNKKSDYSWATGKFKTSWYNIAVPDAPLTYFLQLPVIENIRDIMGEAYKVWLQEFNRINYIKQEKAKDPSFTTGNENMDVNGERYHFLPGLEKDNPQTWESARKLIYNDEYDGVNLNEKPGYLQRKFADYVDELESLGLVEYTNGVLTPTSEFPNVDALNMSFAQTLQLFYLNDWLMSTQTFTQLSGDPAFYKKNKTDGLTSTDQQKRSKQLHSNGIYPFFERATYNVQYLHDLTQASPEDFIKKVESIISKYYTGKVLKDILDSYRKAHELTDAQGYVTLDRWREIKKALNEWSPEHEDSYKRLKAGKDLTNKDKLIVTQPFKPQAFGFIANNQMHDPTQHKYSAVVLHNDLVKDNPLLKQIMDRMEDKENDGKNKIDELIFKTGIKVGAKDVISLDDFINGTISPQVIPHSFYKEQQKVPEHYNGNVSNLLGIQFRKLFAANINKDASYVTDPDLVRLFNELFKTNNKNLNGSDTLKLIDFLQAQNIINDRNNLNAQLGTFMSFVNKLYKAIASKKLGSQFTDPLELRNSEEFKLPISHPLISRKVEEMINSFFKNVSKQKHNGGSFVNTSGIGFKNKFDKDLNIVINDDGSYYVEVAMPKNTKLIGINNNSGELEKIELGIVYRIPTEEKYSMFPIKVVKWLEPSVGGIIAMPREVTTIAGLDFDIDKVYSIMYNYSERNGTLAIPKDLRSREGKENLLLDLYYSVLKHENTFKDFVRPQSVEPLRNLRNAINPDNKSHDVVSLQSRIKFVSRNQAGKNLIGIFATNNSFHALALDSRAMLNKRDLNKIVKGTPYKDEVEINGSLDKTHDFKGELISRSFAMLLSAAVDNAKDPILEDLNINIFTAPMLSLMLHLGIPLEDAIMRINQPDILDETKRQSGANVNQNLIVDPNVKNIYAAARSLGALISAMRIDSGSGPTLHDIDKKLGDIKQVVKSKIISPGKLLPTIDKVKGIYEIVSTNDSPLTTQQYIKVFLDEANFASKHFPYFNESFQKVKDDLLAYQKSGFSMSAKNRRTADIEHMSLLHYKLFGINDPVNFIKNFPNNFFKFRAFYEGKYSDLFKIFTMDNGVLALFDKNQLDPNDQERIKELWDSALNPKDSDVVIRKIAHDLIAYGFMINGYNYTRNSYLNLVPSTFFEQNDDFRNFDSRNYPLNLIAFNTAINNPSKFIAKFPMDFNHNTEQGIEALVRKIEYIDDNEIKYYLPMFTKRVGGEWGIFLNKEFAERGFQYPDDITSSEYTKIMWKDETIKGRTYDFNFNLPTSLNFITEQIAENAEGKEVTEDKSKYTTPEEIKANLKEIFPNKNLNLTLPCD